MSDLKDVLKRELECNEIKPFGRQSGDIQTFKTDNIGLIFVKVCKDDIARPMFEGEMHGLNLLRNINMPNVHVAKTYKIIDLPYWKGGACLVIEFLHTNPLGQSGVNPQVMAGEALAYMHLHNSRMKVEQPHNYVSKFGYDIPTYCGRLAHDNTWKDNWSDFIIKNRIQHQIDLLCKTRDAHEEPYGLWEFHLKHLVHKLFENMTIEPSLLHGDFWASNVGESNDGKLIQIYDPSCFYGHHEYDLAITKIFGGFDPEFYEAYHKIIPKHEPGFDARQKLYMLFHYLNHWNHFGSSYAKPSLSIMRELKTILHK